MSAQELRDAAALMREQAEAANRGEGLSGQRWEVVDEDSVWSNSWIADTFYADHIAAADPTVMLAVADWLDASANRMDYFGYQRGDKSRLYTEALAVARAYLRTEADQ